ncbi:MAG TPA: DDE-type integrase/transposase/recombinase [Bryobacteraceae bacterium]|nr:DDE-type integrase/transposase/recombinase [Bryobacteraceae bacterium]
MLDAFSRRVIGWALGRTLEAEFTLAALRMALRERCPPPGWMHHSDRGVQYASGAYVATLLQYHAMISMSRKGNPYDNAACESFMKTLKYEEVYRNEYRYLPEARASIGQFLDRFITKSGYTPLSAMCRQRNSSNREAVHDPITARPAALGALPPNPRDLPPSGQNVSSFRRRPRPPPRHSGCRVGARVASPHSPILRPGTPRVDDRNLAVQ